MTLKACGCRENEQLIQELSIPAPGSQPLHFETRYPQSALSQFRLIFWKCAALPCRPLDADKIVKWQMQYHTGHSAIMPALQVQACMAKGLISDIIGEWSSESAG